MKCRHCHAPLEHIFIDLGYSPPSNAYLTAQDLNRPETTYPLRIYVCHECWLVQTADFAAAGDLFTSDYAYFSSTSHSWCEHARKYCTMITEKLQLDSKSFVVELAANDGYLLKNFVEKGVPCLGIEPTDDTANAAEKKGVPIERRFFGEAFAGEMAKTYPKADLIIGNNVYAHVPDINDFTKGMKRALADKGTITLEFPHLLELIKHTQFDTIYHEHYSYLSLHTVRRIFESAGLRIFDAEKLATHGGSLRIYGGHDTDARAATARLLEILEEEDTSGLKNPETYGHFQDKADKIKNEFIRFLIDQKQAGKSVAGYGAAAKGNTLLNYAGIKPDLLPFICDAAPSKQGKFMPGSHIPIYPPETIAREKPDIVVILPWNLKTEIKQQLDYIRQWDGHFLTVIPELSKAG